jgi:hypothetical protein
MSATKLYRINGRRLINSILASPLRFLRSLDHLVRPRQHVRRDSQADLLRSLEIDHQLKLSRPLYGQVTRLCALKDLVHVDGVAQIDQHLAKTMQALAGFSGIFGNGTVPWHDDIGRERDALGLDLIVFLIEKSLLTVVASINFGAAARSGGLKSSEKSTPI